ncbi:MAG: sulfotransferase family 2 domain-containing protein [Pseudomonadota bacterium]
MLDNSSASCGRGKPGPHFQFTIGGKTVLYCYIRKNACSAFKRLIVNTSPHRDQLDQFPSRLKFMIKTHGVNKPHIAPVDHSIVVLRDPLDRLVSTFRNKFVQMTNNVGIFENYRAITDASPEAASFERFVSEYVTAPADRLDGHVRPQCDDLAAMVYTDAIELPRLHDHMTQLFGKKLGNRYFAQKRNASSHALPIEIDAAWRLPASELNRLYSDTGTMPPSAAFWTPDLRRIAEQVYAGDSVLLQRLREQTEGASVDAVGG